MKNKILILLAAFSFFTFSCVVEEQDACKETEMPEVQEPVIYIALALDNDVMPHVSDTLYNASELYVNGRITKIYCGGEVSSSFTFNPSFNLASMADEDIYEGFYLPQPYQFKFENDEDYVQLDMQLTLVFGNGHEYESPGFSIDYRYNDLFFDVNYFQKYIKMEIPAGTDWVQFK